MKKILLASLLIVANAYTATPPSKVIHFNTEQNQSTSAKQNQSTSEKQNQSTSAKRNQSTSEKQNQSVMDSFNQLKSKGYVIVDFYADWCGPCKSISPIFNQLSNECNNVTFIKVNIDSYKEIAQKFKVRSIPQLLLFKDGKLVKTLVGKQSKKQIQDTIKRHFR